MQTRNKHKETIWQRKKPENRVSPAQGKLLKHRESKRKCISLTYLLSFFSGGDFLSQPWKMISPPLMFVSVVPLLLALQLSSVTSTWRLLKARLFKVLSAFGSPWRSLLPPFDKNQSSAGRRRSQSLPVVPRETGGVQKHCHWGITHGQLTRSRGETQLMQGEEVS